MRRIYLNDLFILKILVKNMDGPSKYLIRYTLYKTATDFSGYVYNKK